MERVNSGIERRWSFEQVRRAALALAREVERRAPDLASTKWWKEERRGVFLDYMCGHSMPITLNRNSMRALSAEFMAGAWCGLNSVFRDRKDRTASGTT